MEHYDYWIVGYIVTCAICGWIALGYTDASEGKNSEPTLYIVAIFLAWIALPMALFSLIGDKIYKVTHSNDE